MKDNWYRIAKLIIAVLALILFYLYAQNERYEFHGGAVLDKWTTSMKGINEWVK